MKRLLLLRHAKAEQANKDDHARELTGHGRKDAAHMGAWLHKNGMTPDLVLCSTAARTRQTWALVAEELGASSKVEFLKPLYLAPAKTILKLVQNVDGANTLLMVGHNPGTEEAAAMLARAATDKSERHRLEMLKEKFPTAALAILDFDVAQWRDVEPAGGALANFMRPKDLD
jgi:phosphohistidine phosphatase